MAMVACDDCNGTGKAYGRNCFSCDGKGQQQVADWAPTKLPEHQQAARDIEDWGDSKRKTLEIARDRTPGTKVWRGEVRHKDDLERPPSVGLHWSADPDQVVHQSEVEEPDHHRVVWEGTIDHRDQAFDRSHPMWSGRHRSMDSESEVRFRPGQEVHVTRRYVHDGTGRQIRFAPTRPDRTPALWQAHDMDHHVPVAHKPGPDGLIDYSDVGVRKGSADAADKAQESLGALVQAQAALEQAQSDLQIATEGSTRADVTEANTLIGQALSSLTEAQQRVKATIEATAAESVRTKWAPPGQPQGDTMATAGLQWT